MILALSVENTNLVMGCFHGDSLLFTSRMAADRKKTGDEYAISFRSILELYGIAPGQIQGCIVSSVVPALIHEIKGALYLLLQKDPVIVGPGVKTGLNIRIDNPAMLGSDMVCNATAAVAEYPAPMIVIDLDTAITLMAVDSEKRFTGYVIAPGPAVAAAALADACDQLPRISMEAPGEVIGKNTVDCMKSGAIFGTAAMLDGLVERMEDQIGHKCAVVATGTLAQTVVPYCRRHITVDQQLLLKGLKRIYDRNRRK